MRKGFINGDVGRLRWRQRDRLIEMEIAYFAMQYAALFFGRVIRQVALNTQIGAGNIGPRKIGDNKRIADSHVATGAKSHVVPNANISPRNGRQPVPAEAGEERRAIQSQFAAVGEPVLEGFGFDRAGVGNFVDQDSQAISRVGSDQFCDIEFGADERTVDIADVGAVDVNVGFPVNAIEVEPETIIGKGSNGERVAVPEIVVGEKSVIDIETLIAIKRIGDFA